MHLDDAITLLLFALGAFAIPLLTGRLRMPAAVGEILFGLLLGPQLAGLIQPREFTTFLAELGFSVLMFLAGLELDFAHLERLGWRRLALGLTSAGAIFVLAYLLVVILGLPGFHLLVLAATSIGILLATLAELKLGKTNLGQMVIFVGSAAEFLTIVLLTAATFYYRVGLGLDLVLALGKLGLILLAAWLLLVVLRSLIWWWPERFSRMVAARDPAEIGVRAGLGLMLVFVALAALLGIEAILGAFIAGALFSFVFREKQVLEVKLNSIGFGFFIPFFFIWVGTRFDLATALTRGALARFGVLLGASLVVKLLASAPLALAGLAPRQTLAAGILLAAPLTLLVAISRIGLDLQVLDPTTAAAVVLLAMVTSLVMPTLFRWLVRGEKS